MTTVRPAGGDEVVFLVFVGVVADDGAVGDVDVAVDDGVADAAVAADVDVGEDDAGVDVGVGVDADIVGERRSCARPSPETMEPAETMELMAMPVRPGSPKTNLAGGYW